MARNVQKTLYLTENISETDGTGDIEVPPPMLLLPITVDFTGEVVLRYNHGKLVGVDRHVRDRYKPVPLSDRGFRRDT